MRKTIFAILAGLVFLGACQLTKEKLTGLWYGIDTSGETILLEFLPDHYLNFLHNSSPIFKINHQATRYKVGRLDPLELQLYLYPSGEKLGKLHIELIEQDSFNLFYSIKNAYRDTVGMRRIRQ